MSTQRGQPHGRSDVIQVGVDSLGRVDFSQPLLTFLSAEAVMDQSLWVYSGPVDWLDRMEMDGSTVTRIVNGASLSTGRDLAVTAPDVEAVADLVDRYLQVWNGSDPDAAALLYTPDATIEDSLLGRSLRGSDEIADSMGSDVWPNLPPATILALDGRAGTALLPRLSPPRGRAIYVSPSMTGRSEPDEVRIVLEADDGSGCPGALVAELGWDGERILRERRYHEIASTRRCLDPADLRQGWWAGITVPDPVRIEESEPMVWAERDVTVRIFNGSPAAKRFIRWGLERFAAADLPLPRVDSVTFLSCESTCRGRAGLFEGGDDEVAITMCCAAETVCVDQVCSTWYQASRHTLLHELAHAWMAQHMSEQDKQDFLTLENLDNWSDFTDPWPERGMERAAEAIAFALSGTPASACTPDGPGSQYEEGFRLITDREPLATCSRITVEKTAQDPTTALRLLGVAACAQNMNLQAGR
jgi:hypothetical protein